MFVVLPVWIIGLLFSICSLSIWRRFLAFKGLLVILSELLVIWRIFWSFCSWITFLIFVENLFFSSLNLHLKLSSFLFFLFQHFFCFLLGLFLLNWFIFFNLDLLRCFPFSIFFFKFFGWPNSGILHYFLTPLFSFFLIRKALILFTNLGMNGRITY